MKTKTTFVLILIAGLLGVPMCARAQDAATEDAAGLDAAIGLLEGKAGFQLETAGKSGGAGGTGGQADKDKGAKDTNKWKEDEEEERQEEERKRKEAEEAKRKKEEDEAGGSGGGDGEKSEAQEEVEAFEQLVGDLEKKLEAASDDEKATVQAELDKAKEGLEAWQAEVEKEATEARPEFEAEQDVYVKAVEQRAETAGKKVAELEGQVKDLEQQLQQAGEAPKGVAEIPAVLYSSPDEVAKLEGSWKKFEAWALENWDGVEASDDGKQPGYTKEQVRKRYAEIKELREGLIPAAKESLQNQAAVEAAARKTYPELFDGKRFEGKAAQAIVKRYPMLKVIFPDIWTVMRDAFEGEQLRKARQEKAKAGRAGLPSARGDKGRKHLPRAAKPGGGAAGAIGAAGARKAAAAKKKGAEPSVDMDKFMQGGGDKAALVAALS